MECPVTGIKTRFGNRVSHANNKTRRTWQPNMQRKRFWYPAENRFIRLTLSVQGTVSYTHLTLPTNREV